MKRADEALYQAKVEGRNFDIRKHLLDYDDVLNDQRERIYDILETLCGARFTNSYTRVGGLMHDATPKAIASAAEPGCRLGTMALA